MKEKLWLTLISYLAYCIDKEHYKAIDYLREQVRVLIEHQEKENKRILSTNSQRMRVAAKAKRLSRKMLERCTELFTADTVIRWHQKLIAEKYDGSQNRTYAGRPPITEEIVNLVIRFKHENPRWGYKKIRDQVVYLGYTICKSSVKNIRNIPSKYTPRKNRRDRKLSCQATFIVLAVSSLRSASAVAFNFFHSLGRSSSILSAGCVLTLARTSLKYLNGSIPFNLQLATRL